MNLSLFLSGCFIESFRSNHVSTALTSKRNISYNNLTMRMFSVVDSKLRKDSTVRVALEYAKTLFEKYEVVEPEYSSLHLLTHAFNEVNKDSGVSVRFSEIQASPQRILTDNESQLFSQFVDRRIGHEPIQYILGEWDFMDFTIKCRSPILCPRPETEELVEYMCTDIKNMDIIKSRRILDIGSGTGAIGLAIAREFPDASVIAIDKSEQAVKLSSENAKFLGLEESRYVARCSTAKDFKVKEIEKFDFIVSNPPYIPLNDMSTLTTDVVGFEDFDALCGGGDGLDVVRDIVSNMPNLVKPGGYCWMEVDTSHPALIRQWLERNDTIEFVEYRKDFCNRDRFVKLRLNPMKQ